MPKTDLLTDDRVKEIIGKALEDNNKKILDVIVPLLEKSQAMMQTFCNTTKDDKAIVKTEPAAGPSAASAGGSKQKESKATKRKIQEPEKENDFTEIFCSDCNNSFVRGDGSYSRHIDEMNCKPHQCSVCSKRFKKRYTMIQHEESVHSTAVIPCQYPDCKSTFNCDKKLVTHQEKVHGRVWHLLKSVNSGEPLAKRTRTSDESGSSSVTVKVEEETADLEDDDEEEEEILDVGVDENNNNAQSKFIIFSQSSGTDD